MRLCGEWLEIVWRLCGDCVGSVDEINAIFVTEKTSLEKCYRDFLRLKTLPRETRFLCFFHVFFVFFLMGIFCGFFVGISWKFVWEFVWNLLGNLCGICVELLGFFVELLGNLCGNLCGNCLEICVGIAWKFCGIAWIF